MCQQVMTSVSIGRRERRTWERNEIREDECVTCKAGIGVEDKEENVLLTLSDPLPV